MTENPDIRKNILEIQDLAVGFHTEEQIVKAVDHISISVVQGESIGIVGESGSGKTVTALSILKLIPSPPGIYHSGEINFQSKLYGERDLLRMKENALRKIRGHEIAMIFQEPMTSLNPVFTCGNQIVEALTYHKGLSPAAAKDCAIDMLRKVKLPRPEATFDTYPHNLSGGQKQRVMIAMALVCQPQLIIADEPTTALDVTVQANILRLLKDLREDMNTSILFITHDLGVIAEIAERVVVMFEGRIVEEGTLWEVYSDPKHPYTKGLLACRPRLDLKLKVLPTVSDFMQRRFSDEVTGTGIAAGPDLETSKVGKYDQKYTSVGEAILLNVERRDELIERRLSVIQGGPILKVKDLQKYYTIRKGMFGKESGYIKAVDQVSFEVYPGETIGLVGESGCGKTTLGKLLIRLLEPTSGEIIFNDRDIAIMTSKELRELRKSMQIIFQDPYNSLDPRQTIGNTILEPMEIHGLYTRSERKDRVFELLGKVGLKEEFYNRYPHEFSGGQRQRICIARSLSLNPEFIILDESVSALDVSVQAQILNLLNQLKKDFGFTYIFISHDLAVVKFMSDRIFVMRDGKFIEMGFPEDMYLKPREAYTERLIQAIPKGDLEDIRKNMLRRRIIQVARQIRDEIRSDHGE
jgi:peptide/nickel transport system ATP-binding protein